MPGVRLGEIESFIEQLAPPQTAEPWDRCGLQVGDRERVVHTVLISLDPSPAAVNEAARRNAGLLLTHHPLFLNPLADIDLQSPLGARIGALIRNDVALYAAHTSLDKAHGGVNDALAEALGLSGVRPFGAGEPLKKIVVTVPKDHADGVLAAMGDVGAGSIGAYERCFFYADGTGTFTPKPGADPFIGAIGHAETVEEVRLETVVPASRAAEVTAACRDAHPYEEPALDVYPLEGRSPEGSFGRIGELAAPMSLEAFAAHGVERLGGRGARFVGDPGKSVRRVAVSSGSGGEMWPQARAAGADVLVTGEGKYHAACDLADAGFALLEVGHDVSERVVIAPLAARLRRWSEENGFGLAIDEYGEAGPYHWMVRNGP